jgi:hypothetical protein
MKLPAATKSLVKRYEVLCRIPLSDYVLFFEIEFLALGVENVQIIR